MATVWTFGKVLQLIILVVGVLAASFLVQNDKTVTGELKRTERGRIAGVRRSEEKYRISYKITYTLLWARIFFLAADLSDNMPEYVYWLMERILTLGPAIVALISVLYKTRGKRLDRADWFMVGFGVFWMIIDLIGLIYKEAVK